MHAIRRGCSHLHQLVDQVWVLAAARSEARLAEYLGSKAWQENPSPSVRTEADLRRELADVAERRWSLVAEELDGGLRANAVPIRDRDGAVLVSLNMSTRTDGRPESQSEEGLPRLQHAAEEIGADLHARHLG